MMKVTIGIQADWKKWSIIDPKSVQVFQSNTHKLLFINIHDVSKVKSDYLCVIQRRQKVNKLIDSKVETFAW